MSKLFIVYLGGSAPKANIEVHDVQFVVGDCIEDTYDELIERWYGNKKGLHIDSYKEIKGADGYSISLEQASSPNENNLYFVNVGGYRKDKLSEIHDFTLCVACNESEAKEKALNLLLKESLLKHRDNLIDVDDCVRITHVMGHYIHLQKSQESFDLIPDWFGYNVIS